MPFFSSRHAMLGMTLAVVGAVFFSAKAVMVKLLYAEGLDAVTVIALRMLLAAPFFAVVAVVTWLPSPRPPVSDVWRIAGLGLLGYYVSSMLDFLGLQYISAGLARLILFLMPAFVVLLGMLLYGRRISGMQWTSMALAYAGIALVFQHDVSLGGDGVLLGGALVLCAALTYALYLLLSGELVARVGTLRLASLAMLVSCAAGVVQYALLRPLPTLFEQSAEVWTLAAVNATVCTVLPVFMIMGGIARIGAGTTAQAGMIGPVSTLFLAWWLLGDPFTGIQLAGTALVLAGIFVLSRVRQQ